MKYYLSLIVCLAFLPCLAQPDAPDSKDVGVLRRNMRTLHPHAQVVLEAGKLLIAYDDIIFSQTYIVTHSADLSQFKTAVITFEDGKYTIEVMLYAMKYNYSQTGPDEIKFISPSSSKFEFASFDNEKQARETAEALNALGKACREFYGKK